MMHAMILIRADWIAMSVNRKYLPEAVVGS